MEGKAKEAFEKWYYKKHCNSNIKYKNLQHWQREEVFGWLYGSPKTIKYSFFNEWLLSKAKLFAHVFPHGDKKHWGINITDIENDPDTPLHLRTSFITTQEYEKIKYKSFEEATEAAIKKAVEIFNERE